VILEDILSTQPATDAVKKEKTESVAKQKRKPFSVKNGERTHHVYCRLHADSIATFYCASCHKPYGEECVGDERDELSICVVCADAQSRQEIKQTNRGSKLRNTGLGLFATVALTLLCINTYILVNDRPVTEEQAKPVLTSQVSTLIQCRHRLEKIAQQSLVFQQAFKHAPTQTSDLHNLIEDAQQLLEPVTHQPFILSSDDKNPLKASCPNPEVHGLAALYAVPGKPAKMIYNDNLRNQ